ncbi:MAG: HD domain-containing protein [Elusimicrobia bacterium]|nr:HD domain-containing protein [Elusimicrobiota bacterium]
MKPDPQNEKGPSGGIPRKIRLPRWLFPVLDILRGAAGRGRTSLPAVPDATPLYLVGGVVRDILQGRRTHDIDVACDDAAALARALERRTGGRLVVLDELSKVYRVVLTRMKPPDAAAPREKSNTLRAAPGALSRPVPQVDVAQIQGKGIEEDLRRRDFTINAMALPIPAAGGRSRLIDPRGGARDLERGILRAESGRLFSEDPLRLLRAFRIASQLGGRIERRTLGYIRAHRRKISEPAGERIRQELLLLLACPSSHAWLREMDNAGLLTALFAPLEASRRCAEVYYGKGGVLKHSLDAVERMDLLLENMPKIFPGLHREINRAFEADGVALARRGPLLRLAVLLHDIAKPPTAKRIGGRLRFFGHDEIGARMAAELLGRLRLSRDEIDAVCAYILHHLRPGNLAANPVISDKAVFRFFRELGRHAVGLILVCWADHASYLSPARLARVLKYCSEDPHDFPTSRVADPAVRKTLRHLQVLHYLLFNYFRKRERVLPPRLIDGTDVMSILSIPPGPSIGKILTLVQEAQAAGKVLDREQALGFIRNSIPVRLKVAATRRR